MSPLPRFLVLALFVVLTTLVALLTMNVWRDLHRSPGEAVGIATTSSDRSETTPDTSRGLIASHRFALGLGAAALVLSLTLALSLGPRSQQSSGSQPPFAATRHEVGTLARLAESSVAQSAELSRERDDRRRAQEDAALKQQLLTQSLEEKVRLGRDLHDGIIQSLYAVGLTLESARALVKSDPAEADRRLEESRARINSAIRDVRAYITGLAPENLRRTGFAHAVDVTLAELRAGRDTQFDIKIDDVAAAHLSPDQSAEALQIVREAVSNALRHGGASLITIRVHQGDREVCLLVQDNGIGFDASTRREGGHGLGNMQARAERVGATLKLTSRPGEGARLVATLPINSSPAT